MFTAGPEGSLPSPLLRVEHVPSSSSLCLWGGGGEDPDTHRGRAVSTAGLLRVVQGP